MDDWQVCKKTVRQQGKTKTQYGLCRYVGPYKIEYHPYGFIFEDAATAQVAADGLNYKEKTEGRNKK